MSFCARFCDILIVFVATLYLTECSNVFQTLDSKYQLVSEAYSIAKNLFQQGRNSYISLKNRALQTIDTFLDLVHIMNEEMTRELKGAVIKYYKIKYFRDFTNYMISMDEVLVLEIAGLETSFCRLFVPYISPQRFAKLYRSTMVEIVDHCLADPIEKLGQIREQFQAVIDNFEDVRNFDTVAKCHKELPDEVAAAHCILHQAVLFNETMQESLVTIVKVKTRQHAQDMNSSLYSVQECINDFVPKFFDNLLLDAFTENCGYLKIVNSSIHDMMKDKWGGSGNETLFPDKWVPLVKLLKERNEKWPKLIFRDPIFLTLLAGNLTSHDIITTIL